ncbi:MAG: lysophospholipase [Legionella sp.]|nr:MAG: lysophospholipase [Legionella sp.]
MKLLATIGACLFSGVVAATPLHNIVIFGDSLSDNGNLYEVMNHQLPQSPPYYQGRFSNGPVWIELLAASYFPQNANAHLANYAYGGAGVTDTEGEEVLFTLRKEIDTYLLTHDDKASEDSLYVVWIGANNYLGMPTEVDKTIQTVNSGINKSLKRLVTKGAKHILVINLPDLGRTPAAIEFDSIETMSYFSSEHNNAIAKTAEELKQNYPEVEWLFFDMNKGFGEVVSNPEAYGFTNITGTCSNAVANEKTKKSVLRMVASVKPKTKMDACDGFLFFDLVHPSAAAHKILAEKARLLLDASGIEFTEQ